MAFRTATLLLFFVAPAWGTPGGKARSAPPPRGTLEVPVQRADPRPLVTLDFLDLRVRLDRGRLAVTGYRRGRHGKPTALLRYRGRFEARLYAAGALLDIVRFEFPLTAAAGERTAANDRLGRSMVAGVRAETWVRVPLVQTLTRVVVLDARSGARTVWERRLAPISADLPGPRRTITLEKRR